VTQVALAWVAAEGIIAIPGTTRPERLVENFASRDIELNEEDKQEMCAVIEASKPQGDRYSKEASKAISN
jgi:diketogulonate reductase-like aldo/keto reductase